MASSFFTRVLRFAFPVYPLLTGIYPVLYLWSANRAQQPAYVVVRSLWITLLLVCLLYLLAALVLRSLHRAAFTAFLISLYLLTAGRFAGALSSLGVEVHYTTVILVFAGVLLLVFLLTRRYTFQSLAQILNPVSVLLVCLTVFPTGYYYLVTARQKIHPVQPAMAQVDAAQQPAAALPDVYFIVMDAYSRADLFQSRFHFDNNKFVQGLQERGFFIPGCAQSNYPATTPAITSILNMNYLDSLGLPPASVLNEAGSEALGPYLQDNLVFQQFRSYGYRLVTFRGFLSLIDLQNVDYYVDVEQDVSPAQRSANINFEDLYLKTTAFYKYDLVVEALRKVAPEPLHKFFPPEKRFEQMYRQNIYAVDQLKAMPSLVQSPKLVYAHLYASHWPYLINPDGSPRLPYSEAEDDAGYVDGVQYLNNSLLPVIDSILEHSATPPVILLQSDHAYPLADGKPDWSGENRLKMFSAYYLPGDASRLLYDQITPVNDFRLVLKAYMQADIELLPDVSYYVDPASGQVRIAPISCIQ